MALSQMRVPGSTSGRDGVYRRSADSGITEIDAAGRYSWTETFYCPAGPRWVPLCRCHEWQERTLRTLLHIKSMYISTWSGCCIDFFKS